MSNFGLPYQGSKNRIAQKIVDFLPAGGTLYDLFSGGGAIAHCALFSKKWDKIVVNDIVHGQTKFFVDALRGNFLNRTEWISHKEFFELKESDPFIKAVYSFGNKGGQYLYSYQIEPVKKLAHLMLTAKTTKERRIYYRKFIKSLYSNGYLDISKNKSTKSKLRTLERVQSLEAIERVNELNTITNIQIEDYESDYQDITLSRYGVIYCDIPYRSTVSYGKQSFDYERFYSWAENQKLPVFISEYLMPEERFKCVLEIPKTCSMCATKNHVKTIERLYVPKQQA